MKNLLISSFIAKAKKALKEGIIVLHFGFATGLIVGTGMLFHQNTIDNQEKSGISLRTASYSISSMEHVKEEAKKTFCPLTTFYDMVK